MLTRDEVEVILSQVRYKDWQFRVMDKGDSYLVQVVFFEPDCHTGKPAEQHGRKWYVSRWSTKSEVVMTAWAAVERAVIHEAKEAFLYKGVRIMNPHLDVEVLVATAGKVYNEDMRLPPVAEPVLPKGIVDHEKDGYGVSCSNQYCRCHQ